MFDRDLQKKALIGADTKAVAALASRGDSAQGGGTTITAALNAKPFFPASLASVPPNAGGTITARLTNANAAPFVPGGASGGSMQRLASMSSAAAPFVPKAATESPRGAAALPTTRSRAPATPSPAPTSGAASIASTPARSAGDLLLPDGDDLLGMTAHTPGDAAPPSKAALAATLRAERLRQELPQRKFVALQQVDVEAEGDYGLPEVLQQYHSLYPLEDLAAAEAPSQVFGVSTQVIKGVSSLDGQAVALRRIDGRQMPMSADLLAAAAEKVEAWAPLAQHPNLSCPCGAFASGELGGGVALFLVSPLWPCAVTLEQAHLLPTSGPSGLARPSPPSEEQLWSYLVQLTAALRAAHSARRALRSQALAASKVLLTSPGRIRVGSLGIMELLVGEPGSPEEQWALQREDLCAVGHLIMCLACAGAAMPSLEACAAVCSAELTRLVGALMDAPHGGTLQSWRQLSSALGDALLSEVEGGQMYAEELGAHLAREAEATRMLRLVTRLAQILERPEGDLDPQWAETGDRYLIKLFRDFVFHQVGEDGAPLLDWGHIAEALAKLDAGLPEKVMLMSRDEMSMLVVSYADLKRCVEGAYGELRARASQSRSRPLPRR
ncbi:hypothetical protein WJX81_001688 [Elliptochloris bilobata]|uniref:Pan3 C-terminal knob domain-containing protein n=1 Tax=Elliptochloris bilobata TaxID=381761 RepID=A0AAW1RAN9_9CHLO